MKHFSITHLMTPMDPSCELPVYAIGWVINDVCQYSFYGDSYFYCILYIQKGIYDFFSEIIWFSFVDFHFKKIWRRGGPKYFLLKNMDLL